MVELHSADRLLVQIGSYNTNLQGGEGLPQDLVDWLSPTLQVSTFLSREPRAPDIVAIGFQELLPLHLGLSGLSKALIADRAALIKSQIEKHSPTKGESYSLVGTVVNVGVALLVFARDAGVARQVCDVQTQWTGSGPAWMGNKGAVGLRFRVKGVDGSAGEVFTFVCAHLTAHEPKLARRIADWNHIVGSLLFDAPPHSPSPYNEKSTIYATSHLFFLGDLNFRVSLPPAHPLTGMVAESVHQEDMREQLKEHDQLIVERRKGTVFQGLREGDFWKFQCSYKYKLGEVDKYSTKRVPSWTDRIMYSTYTDSFDTPDQSNIDNLLYTSIPSFTSSDHKPVICLLLLPAPPAIPFDSPPLLRLPASYHPTADPHAVLKRYTGRTLDRIIGYVWWLVTLFGMGSTAVGVLNFLLGIGAWKWWGSRGIVLSTSA
ncbi:inositol polyphosphate phosphatase [Athelia psychrophila]|uniref:Inositol polyphosphate phosphatase n=1 Tax=Athelia psychrophila TaxID=1759441 RepID=A0A166BEL5_9AGAM|nr:inositol polyphosphate phosphatase [Fibularhizoctonia sp. CBS 109695]